MPTGCGIPPGCGGVARVSPVARRRPSAYRSPRISSDGPLIRDRVGSAGRDREGGCAARHRRRVFYPAPSIRLSTITIIAAISSSRVSFGVSVSSIQASTAAGPWSSSRTATSAHAFRQDLQPTRDQGVVHQFQRACFSAAWRPSSLTCDPSWFATTLAVVKWLPDPTNRSTLWPKKTLSSSTSPSRRRSMTPSRN